MKKTLLAILLAVAFLGAPVTYTSSLPSNPPVAAMAPGVYSASVDATNTLAWLQKAKESTVAVFTPEGGHGTGVAYKRDGAKLYILTCAHVVEGTTTTIVRIILGGAVRSYASVVVKVDEANDIAMIVADEPSMAVQTLKIASADPAFGAVVYSLGYPRDIRPGLASVGFCGMRSKRQYGERLQHSGGVWFGYSGGPLLNASGEIIGINSNMGSNVDGNDSSIGFAITIDTINAFIGE